MPEFTAEQRRVIEFGRGDLLVSAAAGSGKTAVLVERILYLVKNGADIASFLVVTFTRAAADELRERLLLRLEKEAEADPALRPQLERLPLASISTIHAFCRALLTRYSEKAGVDPNLRVASEAEQTILRIRALDDVLDEAYADEAMLSRLERMGGAQQVRLNVESLYRFLMCQVDPFGWLERAEARYDEDVSGDFSQAPWFLAAREEARRSLRAVCRRIEEAVEFAKGSAEEDCRKVAGLIAGDLAAVRAAAEAGSAAVKFATFRSPNRSTDWDSEDLYALRQWRDAYKEACAAALKGMPVCDDWTRAQMAEMSEALHALAEVTRRFHAEFARLKANAGVVDYNDLEQLTLKLTQDESVCEDLRQRYSQIFVDEFQDSSAVQETLLRRAARGDNTFHVGDVKQSIYGFRQSDPGLFLAEQARYARGEGGTLISLNRNFRSLPNVLNSVNEVFRRCMTRESCGIEYDEAAELYAGRTGDGEGEKTIFLTFQRDANEKSPTAREAEVVADLIERLVGTPVSDGQGGTRPARYSDIVVLRRAVVSALPKYMECFARRGIPAYAGGGGSFYETPEVRAALDVLWAVHNPLEDVHLLGALRGAGGFAAEDLARLRLHGRATAGKEEDRRVYSDLLACRDGEDVPEELREKALRFLKLLETLRRVAREEKLSVLCTAVLEETGMLADLMALPHGQTRAGNLRSLPERAAEYDEAGLRLGDFLRRIDSTAGRSREEDVPAFSENDDVVRIMSVHKSKGLQFPIVIGAGLGSRFRFGNDRDADGYRTSRVYCHREYGLALDYYDPESAASDSTVMTRALAALRRREDLAEEMRILYVLMTRAQERLALVGDRGEEKKRWSMPLDDPQCLLDFVEPAVWGNLFHWVPSGKAPTNCWQIEGWKAKKTEATEASPAPQAPAIGEPSEETLAQLRFVYPYPQPEARQKQSVTELTHGAQSVFAREKPAFLQEKSGLRGAERGSALHRFLEIADFAAFAAQEEAAYGAEVRRQTEEAERLARMTPEEGEAVRAADAEIARFLQSEIGRAIRGGAPTLREKPFELRLDAGGQMRLVQGVIDLIVLQADGALLVDYKTDHTGLDAQSVRARHGAQVRLYREAARRAGLAVKRSLVYLFSTGQCVEIGEEETGMDGGQA